MALRIGGAKPMPPPVEEEMPMEEAPAEEMPVEEPMPEEMPTEEPPMGAEPPMGMVEPSIAGYKGPEEGPFSCGHCAYYMGEGKCSVLAGPVEEDGLCNLFMSPAPEESEEEMPMDEEEMPAEEAPEEPEMPEEV